MSQGEAPAVGERIVTIPNALSLLRLVLVPVFAVLIVTKHDWYAIAVLMVSGWTDYFDGLLARRWGQITRVGQLLDPLADRLYILVTLLGLAYRDVVPWWLVGLLVLRDGVLTLALLVLRRAGQEPLPVSLIGKAATFNLLYAFPLLLLGHAQGRIGDVALPIGWAFAWWGTGLYVWSAVIYLRQTAAVLARSRQPVGAA